MNLFLLILKWDMCLSLSSSQVYYVKDNKDPNWLVVMKKKTWDWYDMLEKAINDICQEKGDIDYFYLYLIPQIISMNFHWIKMTYPFYN